MAKSYLSKNAMILCVVLVFTLMSVEESAAALNYNQAGTAESAGLLFRKVYLEKKKTGFKIVGMPEVGSYGNHETSGVGEQRKVPSGPNPLHHHGQDPRKPRTP